ncbi:MAG TPA: NAD(P)-dependent oxidoreductase [Syntrophorhabdaceae bacterium]|nr:NAD(P)-dependent oxidoreductase [Syntrophorhabdaceae bacterium]
MNSYDIIHFEALGPEAQHLENETIKAQANNELPQNLKYLITPDNVQSFLKMNPGVNLPDIVTTKTHSVLPESYFTGVKKSILTRSAGYDHFEHLVEMANIASLREYCVNAVAQTTIKFLYAIAGELNHYEKNTLTFERNNARAFTELGKHKTATVFGAGKIGKRIHDLVQANDLTVQCVDIRQNYLNKLYGGSVKFVSRETAIATSDIIINAMNLTRNTESIMYNVGYFSEEFLAGAKDDLIFINVTRGEIAPESVLLNLYTSGKIKGIGVDVFSNEVQFAGILNGNVETDQQDLKAAAAMVQQSIERSANIYVQPHQGFNSDIAALAKATESIKHVIAWYRNRKQCFDEQLPYY